VPGVEIGQSEDAGKQFKPTDVHQKRKQGREKGDHNEGLTVWRESGTGRGIGTGGGKSKRENVDRKGLKVPTPARRREKKKREGVVEGMQEVQS